MGSSDLPGGVPVRLVRRLVSAITVHHTMLAAAGVAFYCALAVVPALTGVVAVYGLVASPDDVAEQLEPLTDALPAEAGELLVAQLEAVTRVGSAGNAIGLAISVVGVLWLISNAVNAMVMSIRLAHERRSPHNWIQGRIFALTLSAVAVVVVAAVLWLVIALPAVLDGTRADAWLESLLQVARWPAVIIVGVASQTVLYRLVLGPGALRYRVSIGAFAGTAMWIAGTAAMGVFMSNVDRLESTFGSLGTVAVLLFWFYLSALAVLLGAEIDAAMVRDDGAQPANPFVPPPHDGGHGNGAPTTVHAADPPPDPARPSDHADDSAGLDAPSVR